MRTIWYPSSLRPAPCDLSIGSNVGWSPSSSPLPIFNVGIEQGLLTAAVHGVASRKPPSPVSPALPRSLLKPKSLHLPRAVQRGFISTKEAKDLRALADFGMKNGGGAGGATIMDLPSGALSYGEQFIDIHQVAASPQNQPVIYCPCLHTRPFVSALTIPILGFGKAERGISPQARGLVQGHSEARAGLDHAPL